MNQQPDEQRSVRRYLLGELSQAEQQRLEERLMSDDLALEELLVAEDELIDDYLQGALARAEQERFENFFLLTAERQEKLKFATALRRYVAKETAKADHAVPPTHRAWWFVWGRSFFASPLGVVM